MVNPHSLRHTLQIDRHRLFNQAMDVSPGAGHGQVGMGRTGRTDGSHFDLRVGKQPIEVAVGPGPVPGGKGLDSRRVAS